MLSMSALTNTPQGNSLPPAIEGCLAVLARCQEALQAVADSRLETSGPHLRHTIEHFTCLLDGVDAGMVDYDARRRDAGLESSGEMLATALEGLCERLRGLNPARLGQPLRVRQMAAPREAVVVQSTIARELLFLSNHTIHHLALIQQDARHNGIVLDPKIALAFSTAAHYAAAD